VRRVLIAETNAMLTMIPILPDTAPFTGEQRSWLNGFFAGLLGGADVEQTTQAARSFQRAALDAPPDKNEPEEGFPWHDAAMPMQDRLRLAADRPYPRKLMAAMAQLDCGACGYLCKTYAEAIASGEQSDLSLCQPGGKATAKQLKQLAAEHKASGGGDAGAESLAQPSEVNRMADSARGLAALAVAPNPSRTFDRDHPFPSPLLANERLNKSGSAKDTRFISLDLTASGLTYKAGDALGVWPQNCFEHADDVLRLLGYHGGEPVTVYDGREVTVREALVSCYEISEPGDALIGLLARCATDPQHAKDLHRLSRDEEVDGLVDEPRIIDVLARFGSVRPRPQEFIDALRRIKPRLYSISSSPLMYGDEVHLTVGVVRYDLHGRPRKGVASTYLAERVLPRQPVGVFVQPSHAFAPPADPDSPMIMIGPGTGIAPFRAFLQERKAQSAGGENWLFFGDQHEATDFLYRDELEQYTGAGLLTRLDTAFSRDGDDKLYVQHRMLQCAADLWGWLRNGASVYVCGDARRMARDVDQTLRRIVSEQGGMSAADADGFINELAETSRYQRDVY
jgi:sulfite reductase (NADPH) flavoprotein alpha-component